VVQRHQNAQLLLSKVARRCHTPLPSWSRTGQQTCKSSFHSAPHFWNLAADPQLDSKRESRTVTITKPKRTEKEICLVI
jgi:hypothetical protein